ncbi:MAG: zinc transporter ZntB [Gammaproteobacteria bacterium]
MTDEESSPFICAYVLDRNGGGRDASASDIDAWTPNSGLLWVHLDVLDRSAQSWVDGREDIDDVMRDALMAVETRPRAVPHDRGLLLVLRGVNMNPGSDPDDMVAIRVWLEPDRILTSRRRKLLSIQDMRDAIEAGHGPKTPGEFVVSLVERLADRIGKVVNDIEEAIDSAEEEALERGAAETRSKISEIRRQIASIRRYLAPQRDALDRMYRQPGALFSNSEAQELREEADRITRYLEDLDLARERAIVLQEEMLAKMAQEQNSRMYLLSVVAAVFLPLTFVTGLLGMNVAGLPGTEDPAAFVTASVIMVALGGALLVLFRWMKWL